MNNLNLGLFIMLFAANQASAFDTATQIAALEFVESTIAQSSTDCFSILEERQKKYILADVDIQQSVLHELEANRLACQALRQQDEISRLLSENQRLKDEINRIESIWQRDHFLSPKRNPDFPGRNRSQRIMAANIKANEFSIFNLEQSRDNLKVEAVRIASLAQADFLVHSQDEQIRIIAAIDASTRKSIFDRFKEGLPPSVG